MIRCRWYSGLYPVVAAFLLALAPVSPAASDASAPNVLLVLVDDLGIEHLGFYGIGQEFIPTPTLDAMAERGIVFTNAWGSPVCSNSRALLQTGRHAFRTGVGDAVQSDDDLGLPLAELTLPELLKENAPVPYATAAFGKWHLGVDPSLGGALAPNEQGYDHFEGTARNLRGKADYFEYSRITNGEVELVQGYITSDTVDAAIAWTASAPEPWFAYVAFHAPHTPMHFPPDELHTQDTGDTSDLNMYRAMTEAMDRELSRLLRANFGPDTVIVFASDNGSPKPVAQPPIDPGHAKKTVFEGGVRVPFIIAGRSLPAGTVHHPVNLADLYPTIAGLAGAQLPSVEIDGVSLQPYLWDPGAGPERDYNFTEYFAPNGSGPYDIWYQAMRDSRYKLVRKTPDVDRFFDLQFDPWETVNLLDGELSEEEQAAYDDLVLQIETLVP